MKAILKQSPAVTTRYVNKVINMVILMKKCTEIKSKTICNLETFGIITSLLLPRPATPFLCLRSPNDQPASLLTPRLWSVLTPTLGVTKFRIIYIYQFLRPAHFRFGHPRPVPSQIVVRLIANHFVADDIADFPLLTGCG